MTTTANRAFDAHPNVLSGQTVPNTMGGLGAPIASGRLGLPPRPFLAAAGAVLAGLAVVVALARA
jgi:hypothetical protein